MSRNSQVKSRKQSVPGRGNGVCKGLEAGCLDHRYELQGLAGAWPRVSLQSLFIDRALIFSSSCSGHTLHPTESL